jgi:DNA replication protein DnaC
MNRKKDLIKQEIKNKHGCSGNCNQCIKNWIIIDKLAEANIPVGYWLLNMKKFLGPEHLKNIIDEYILNINNKYNEGRAICFAGNQGTGKTMSSTCILKAAIKNNYQAYYITAHDLLSEMIGKNYEIKQKLRTIDFLVIDELDSRFFPSDASKELFSSQYENIFRNRCHNMLPTILCTNETEEILNVFYGSSLNAISSLNKQYLTIYPVVGRDFRKKVVL